MLDRLKARPGQVVCNLRSRLAQLLRPMKMGEGHVHKHQQLHGGEMMANEAQAHDWQSAGLATAECGSKILCHVGT